jgi:hypothetical protein
MSLKPEDYPVAYELLNDIFKAEGEWGKEQVQEMLLVGEEESNVNRIVILLLLTHIGCLGFEPVSNKFALTDEGEKLLELLREKYG